MSETVQIGLNFIKLVKHFSTFPLGILQRVFRSEKHPRVFAYMVIIFFRLHDRHLWSAQTSSDLKLPTESDSDSINDYAGGFVCKYSTRITNSLLLEFSLVKPKFGKISKTLDKYASSSQNSSRFEIEEFSDDSVRKSSICNSAEFRSYKQPTSPKVFSLSSGSPSYHRTPMRWKFRPSTFLSTNETTKLVFDCSAVL